MTQLEGIQRSIRRYYYQSHPSVSETLIEAILYSFEGGGKQIRPRLLLELLSGFQVDITEGHYDLAASLEMIHVGSLIHDDLPAMDDDDYRRGRLTNHKQFGEATAILAGDSLFLDAFGLLAAADLDDSVKVKLLAALSSCSGTFGMVGGQALDMEGEKKSLSLEELQQIHANKTGQLLTFPFIAIGLLLDLPQKVQEQCLQAGRCLGLAFQVRDDILDVTATFEEIGKTPQKDVAAQKATYPSLLGLEKSYEILDQSLDQAALIFQDLALHQGFHPEEMEQLLERLRLNG